MPEPHRRKSYWILYRGTQWLLCAGGTEQGILCSDNRQDLVRLACRLGLDRDADICILGEEKRIEARLFFENGRLKVNGPHADHLMLELIRLGEDVTRGAAPLRNAQDPELSALNGTTAS